jgi:hypothetical protein
MNVRTQRKRFGALAIQLRECKVPLSDAQLDYLAEAFQKISEGSSADIALALSHTAGYSEAKEISVEDRAKIIHWMFCAMQLSAEGGYGLNLEQATIAAMHLAEGDWINPINGDRFTYKDKNGNLIGQFKKYTYDTLQKIWYDSENQRFKTTDLSSLEVGSPYPLKK